MSCVKRCDPRENRDGKPLTVQLVVTLLRCCDTGDRFVVSVTTSTGEDKDVSVQGSDKVGETLLKAFGVAIIRLPEAEFMLGSTLR